MQVLVHSWVNLYQLPGMLLVCVRNCTLFEHAEVPDAQEGIALSKAVRVRTVIQVSQILADHLQLTSIYVSRNCVAGKAV